ncbi:MAG: hypothetical protein GC206_10170 [Alphaproteobacteria bacterium]|nr:hypothetical protein [Alphaproteobacteria bacterium]
MKMKDIKTGGKLLGLMALAAAATSCSSAGFGRVAYTRDGPAGRALMIDASQRAIMSSPARDALAEGARPPVLCAEPSPDSVTAMGFAASGNFEDDERSAQANVALSQSAASIGIRTPSIQLLRDGMYRLCEAYQNGAIDGPTYGDMLAQYQQMVVGLVAIEQLTGTVRASQVTLSAGEARAANLNTTYNHQTRIREQLVSRQAYLNSRIQAITAAQTTRNNAVSAGSDPLPPLSPDHDLLESYRTEHQRYTDNIDALDKVRIQNTTIVRTEQGNVNASNAGTNIAGGASSIETQIPNHGIYTATTAEVIAKAVRDITFRVMLSGESISGAAKATRDQENSSPQLDGPEPNPAP